MEDETCPVVGDDTTVQTTTTTTTILQQQQKLSNDAVAVAKSDALDDQEKRYPILKDGDDAVIRKESNGADEQGEPQLQPLLDEQPPSMEFIKNSSGLEEEASDPTRFVLVHEADAEEEKESEQQQQQQQDENDCHYFCHELEKQASATEENSPVVRHHDHAVEGVEEEDRATENTSVTAEDEDFEDEDEVAVLQEQKESGGEGTTEEPVLAVVTADQEPKDGTEFSNVTSDSVPEAAAAENLAQMSTKEVPATMAGPTDHKRDRKAMSVAIVTPEAGAAQANGLLALPLDSLHHIASFLTPKEWALWGSSCKATHAAAKQVMMRVLLHGFKCAIEVISALEARQYGDAKELAALYIAAGVPIYPKSFGHSYRTLVWRIRVQVRVLHQQRQEQQLQRASNNNNNNNSTRDTLLNTPPPALDPFYNERLAFRASQGYSAELSYVEEKALFWMQQRNQLTRNSTLDVVAASPNRGRSARSVGSSSRSMLGSLAEDPDTERDILSILPIHQHLLDQHLLGRYCVDDLEENMPTTPLSLSADFLHPRQTSDWSVKDPLPPCRMLQNQQQHRRRQQQRPEQLATAAIRVARAVAGQVDNPTDNGHIHDDDDDGDDDDIRMLAADLELRAANPPPPPVAALLAAGFPPPPGLEGDVAAAAGEQPPPPPRLLPPPLARIHSTLQTTEFQPYSSSLVFVDGMDEVKEARQKKMRAIFAIYEARFRACLDKEKWQTLVDECLLDLWDEFLAHTALIQYWDSHTAVPRPSKLQLFLTRPCPKAVGIIQCEIERIKSTSQKKGSVKGRFFPTYEYRLFIRHHPPQIDNDDEDDGEESSSRNAGNEDFVRRDLLLLVAKHQGRNKGGSFTGHSDYPGGTVISSPVSSSYSKSNKKGAGANNYGLYLPQKSDADAHFLKVNNFSSSSRNGRQALSKSAPSPPMPTYSNFLSDTPQQMGRLQGNFIGTEFQLFVPRVVEGEEGRRRIKQYAAATIPRPVAATSDDEEGYDSGGFASDTNTHHNTRRSRFSRFLRSPTNATTSDTNRLRSRSAPSRSPHQASTPSKSCTGTAVAENTSNRRPSRRAVANENQSATNNNPWPASSETVVVEEEDGVITYTANLLGSRPRIMDVCIPKVQLRPGGDVVVGAEWKRYLEECANHAAAADSGFDFAQQASMLHCFKQLQQRLEVLDPQQPRQQGELQELQHQQRVPAIPAAADVDVDAGGGNTHHAGGGRSDDFGLLALQNRPPWWNVELGSFVLNFGGRVSVASVKNFQLVDRHNQDDIMLQFGRIQGRHAFTMDFQYPLTAIQAFAIAISSLQSKMSFG